MEMIKPTQEKKKKKMTTKRTQEIIRRKSTMLTLNASTRKKNLEVTEGGELEGFSRRGSFLDPPVDEILSEMEMEERSSQMDVEAGEVVDEDENPDKERDEGAEDDEEVDEGPPSPKFDDYNSDSEKIELGELDLWRCTQPITVIKDISRKMKSRRASERRRSSELSDSDTKDLIRLQRTVNVMKGERKASNAQFFWDDLVPRNGDPTKDAPLMRVKVKEAMSKDAAMSVLGLKLTTEGKNKKPLNLTDYTEDELLVAFRETCAVIDEEAEKDRNVTKMDAHEAYQVLLKILRAKNKFLKKISAKNT